MTVVEAVVVDAAEVEDVEANGVADSTTAQEVVIAARPRIILFKTALTLPLSTTKTVERQGNRLLSVSSRHRWHHQPPVCVRLRVIPLHLTVYRRPVLQLADKDPAAPAGVSARIEAKSTQLVIVFGLAPVRLQFVFRMVILQASDGRMPCVAIETVCRESAGVLRRPTTLHITKY